MFCKLSEAHTNMKKISDYNFLFLLLLFYFFLFQYCRTTYYADPTSYFFDPKRAYSPGYSARRRDEAAAFIQQKSDVPSRRLINDTQPKLCIGIASIAREGVHYLHYSTGSLLHGLSPEERQQIDLITLLAHANASKHPDASSTWLLNVADQVLDYGPPFENQEYIQSLELDEDKQKEKSLFDYVHLLEACKSTRAEFVFIMEDDTVAAEGWFRRTIDGLRSISGKMRAMGRDPTHCKLYLMLKFSDISFRVSRVTIKSRYQESLSRKPPFLSFLKSYVVIVEKLSNLHF
jgi:hypothetical protein